MIQTLDTALIARISEMAEHIRFMREECFTRTQILSQMIFDMKYLKRVCQWDAYDFQEYKQLYRERIAL